MTSNAGKRIEKLTKALDQLATRHKRHVFVLVQEGETQETVVARLEAEGKLRPGDDMQVIDIPWTISPLRGEAHIPEGNEEDPFADPRTKRQREDRERGESGGMGASVSSQGFDLPPTWAQDAERQRKWKEHERKIEAEGSRYGSKDQRLGDKHLA